MADSGLFWVLVVAVVVSTVVLAVVCLRCRRSPQVCFSQATASEDYLPSPQFRVIHPSQTNPDLNSEPLPSHLLSPYFPSSDLQNHRREQSLTATETGADYINAESDADEPGYIMVLPEEHIVGTNDSRGSTPSSGTLRKTQTPIVVSSADFRIQFCSSKGSLCLVCLFISIILFNISNYICFHPQTFNMIMKTSQRRNLKTMTMMTKGTMSTCRTEHCGHLPFLLLRNRLWQLHILI
ncbi:uncharacterized protein AB9W97_000141 isoform 2-T2 [Spinachia spinachia]